MRIKTALLLFAILPLSAQLDTGVITGLVTDSTGAAVADAKVNVEGEQTGLRYTVETNATGLFVSPGLRTGSYKLTVGKDGFRTETRTGVTVRVQDRVQMNFTLDVGATRAEVTVRAEQPLLESETSSIGQVVGARQIAEMPINGRNIIDLATLAAGTSPSRRSNERDSFVSNGARPQQNSYLLDGVENKNHVAGYDGASAQVIQVNQDMVQEFKVQTSTFSAEFGQSAGGVVNVTLKSGSNDLHGALFHFLRNDKIQAKPFFQPVGGGKPVLRQNQFGSTLGGPIVRNRTFFFGSWQSSRASSTAPTFATVPTEAQRNGNFGARPMFDPTTYVAATNSRTQFPGNTIPQSRFDAVSRQIVPLYPMPNLSTAANNFFSNQKQIVEANQWAGRIDHQLTPRDTLFLRVIVNRDKNLLPAQMPPPATLPTQVDIKPLSAAVSETHSLSPGMVNEFRYAFIRSYNRYFPSEQSQFPNPFAGGGNDFDPSLPNFTPTGFTVVGTGAPAAGQPIPATGSGNHSTKVSNVYHLMDNLSMVQGRHSLKFGGDWQFVGYNNTIMLANRPSFAFDGRFTNDPRAPATTGQPLGDLLLGFPQSVDISSRGRSGLRQRIFQAYALDDWKVTNRLTINAGLRWELVRPFFEVNDRQSNFIRESDSPAFHTLVLASESGKAGLGRSLTTTDRNNLAPRFGFAYSARSKLVIRSAFGVFYGRDEGFGVNRRLVNNPPFFVRTQLTTSQTATNVKLDRGIPSGSVNPATVLNPEVSSFARALRTPYVMQWNFNIEHQLTPDTVFQIGYVGSGARKLIFPYDANRPVPAAGNVQARRPVPQYAAIWDFSGFVRSSYNSLIARVERRYSGGLFLLASYTYGHSLDNSGTQGDIGDPGPMDIRNLNLDRASSNFDVRHRFVFSYVWELPFGRGRRFLAANPAASAVLGGWSVSGITALQGGLPFTVQLNRDPSNSGSPGRPDRLRDGSLPDGQRSVSRWFDTTAFVDPAVPSPGVFRFGNSGRSILRGPGSVNSDFAVLRLFRITERWRLQFRSEFFNLFNTPQFGLPNPTFGTVAAGTITTVVVPERQIQFGLKLLF